MSESCHKPSIVLFAGKTRQNPGALISLQARGSSQILGVLSTLPVTAEVTEVTGPPCHPLPASWALQGRPGDRPFGPGSVGPSADAGCGEGSDSHLRAEMKEPLALGDERAGGAGAGARTGGEGKPRELFFFSSLLRSGTAAASAGLSQGRGKAGPRVEPPPAAPPCPPCPG